MSSLKKERAGTESSYFDRFGLPSAFDLDIGKLEAAYIDLQQQLHPDRFAGKSGAEKLAAQSEAVGVNQAYQTLKDPLKRASYILRQNGVDFDIESERTIHDQDLLMEMLERREELAETTDSAAIDSIKKSIQSDLDGGQKSLSAALSARDWGVAKSLLLRLRYLQKFQTELREKQRELLND